MDKQIDRSCIAASLATAVVVMAPGVHLTVMVAIAFTLAFTASLLLFGAMDREALGADNREVEAATVAAWRAALLLFVLIVSIKTGGTPWTV